LKENVTFCSNCNPPTIFGNLQYHILTTTLTKRVSLICHLATPSAALD